jgi:hypothetical protein
MAPERQRIPRAVKTTSNYDLKRTFDNLLGDGEDQDTPAPVKRKRASRKREISPNADDNAFADTPDQENSDDDEDLDIRAPAEKRRASKKQKVLQDADDSGFVDTPEDVDDDEEFEYVDIEDEELEYAFGTSGAIEVAAKLQQFEDRDDEFEDVQSLAPQTRSGGKKLRPKISEALQAVRSQRKLDARAAGTRVHQHPPSYRYLNIRPVQSLLAWQLATKLSIDVQITRGRNLLEEMFTKRKLEASQWAGEIGSIQCPFRKDVLQKFQSMSAESLADFILSGMCRYRQWLMGLGRPPSREEHAAIPGPTSEELASWGVYVDITGDADSEGRYVGSATAVGGVGQRWWQGYELKIETLRNGMIEPSQWTQAMP